MPQNPEEESFIEEEVVSTIKSCQGPSKIRIKKCPLIWGKEATVVVALARAIFVVCGIDDRSGLRNYGK